LHRPLELLAENHDQTNSDIVSPSANSCRLDKRTELVEKN
jgi:hypothetical protein